MGSRFLHSICSHCCIRQNFEPNDHQETFLTQGMGATQSSDVSVNSRSYRQRGRDLSPTTSEEIARAIMMRIAERQRQSYPINIDRSRGGYPSSSAYVNELYMNSAQSSREEANHQVQQEEKRKARVRGLLEQMKTDVFKDGQNDDECAICMIEFEINEEIRKLPCNHVYHLKCIDDWLLRSFTCPSCMEPVDSALLSAFTPKQTIDLSQLACSPASVGSSFRSINKNSQDNNQSKDVQKDNAVNE